MKGPPRVLGFDPVRADGSKAKPKGETDRPKRRRRRKPLTLAKLTKKCRSAPTVWLGLVESAEGKRIATPTRPQLVELTGISQPKTISRALTALEWAGWIDRCHKPKYRGGKQTATLLRIVLRR